MSSKDAVDVQSFIDHQAFSGFQWLIFVLCFLIVLLDGFDTAAIGYIAPSLIQEWGVTKPDLAPVLSAALFGLAGGALLSGPLADRLGRRLVLNVAVLVFAVASLVSAFAADLQSLTVLRFLTGLGLGAAMPNAVTLISEYSPTKRRALITTAMFSGFPLGAALGGFLAAWMIPQFGWRSVLVLGGIAPIVLVAVMLIWLPESVRYMVAKGMSAERIRAVLGRISAAAAGARSFCLTETVAVANGKSGLGVVLSRSRVVGSVMLWLAYFMGLVIFYALINWMPILFKEAGLDPKTATLISALFPLGGCAAVFVGWLMDRFNGNRIVAIAYALTAVSVYSIGQVVGNVGALVVVVFLAGTMMNAAQVSMPALAATFYPTQGRATGVAWMLGIGRFGGIAGSFLVAELARRKLGFSEVFMVVAIPGLLATTALILKQFFHPETAPEQGEAPAEGAPYLKEQVQGAH
ncbi:MFS transporter, AAHS family, 4-hydroxybenzoate transporter [Aromatoleum tolulyticum]|uniref:MFS transporter, AAHS family, 4-hydroxybenzoate transporter n=1 Tax=Aromatoleum tolulyticum TaxID=34027 RepID=A0A1N6QWU3_9RHOO|nr:MFS transporter [Aromatoleum tolulyticum]SIQ21094.1 MFS transporter, AAHS family, 4-hydroxybenzoate transporter [Aromatoleum tolulyticum]